MVTIKAISVKQPYANLIADGRKTIETRVWQTRYRGPLLIVSSKLPRISPAGCAVAVVNLIDCRPMTIEDETAACCRLYPQAQAWILADLRRIQPFAVKGALRLFTLQVKKEALQVSKELALFSVHG